ncbi:MAG: O-antigen ligase family protein [Patescibacteria group bacterium]
MALIKNKIFWLIIILAALITASLSLTNEGSWYPLIFLIFILLFLIFLSRPELGIYLIALLFPYNDWLFIYYEYNIPYVDLIALLLFIAWLARVIYLYLEKREKLSLKNFPLLGLMLVFIIASFLSLLNIEGQWLLMGIKYIFRPIIFFYLMFVILPFNIIDNYKKLDNTFKIICFTGMILAFIGIVSLIIPPFENINRAMPISIFGIWPLGSNQNALAEIFVVTIPLALILFWKEKDIFMKAVYLICVLLMAGVNMLTLSRAGWIAFAMELLLLVILKYRHEVKKFFTNSLSYIIGLLLVPVIYLMYQLFASGIVSASDSNRLKLIDIALTLFSSHPFLGNGAGTFTLILGQIRWYLIEYGGVLDAHSYLFKTLAETGVVGTLSFIALLAYVCYIIFRGYIKAKDSQASLVILGCFLAVIGAFIFQFFGTSYYLAKMWLPVGLALASLQIFNLYKVKLFT